MAKAGTMLDRVLGGRDEAPPDPASLTVQGDPAVIATTKAEADATSAAHAAEEAIAPLDHELSALDAAYTAACASEDEAATRSARKAWIAGDEQARAAREKSKRLLMAAVQARERRQRAEEEAEARVVKAVREAIRRNVAEVRWHVEGVGSTSTRSMIQLTEERRALADVLDRLAPWGSPAAKRLGHLGGGGDLTTAVLTGLPVNRAFRFDPNQPHGGQWGIWLDACRRYGVLEG